MKLSEYKIVHCIGIGGIGLSALARYCKHAGAVVSGSDTGSSKITDDLQKEGMTIFIGHDAKHVKENTDLLIYSIAVPETNPELAFARSRGITCMTYPEALGELTKEYTTIAVCGTHGKTTTTAMVASMLRACGKDPTVIIGSLLQEGGTNFIKGNSEYLVVEACEYRRSFLNLHPTHVLVTNIDADHLDYYKDIHDIVSAFQSFTEKIPTGGYLITHDDVELSTPGSQVRADDIDTRTIELSVFGEHNKRNAQLALSLARILSLPEDSAREGLKLFTGTWRRLEYKGETHHGVKVYDDYGHHPTEIRATIEALYGAFPKDTHKLHIFFQPHLYSRTKLLLNDFVAALSIADAVYVMPIYAAREKVDETITHQTIVDALKAQGITATALTSKEEMKSTIEALTDVNGVALNIGAGDAYTVLDGMELLK